MSASTIETLQLSVIEQRISTETCSIDQSGAASLSGSTLQATSISDSGSTSCPGPCQISLDQASTRDGTQSSSVDSSGETVNPVLQFLLKTWLGNAIAIVALLIAIASLGMTAYSSVLQAVAAKWSMRNDAFQSCLSASTLNMSTRYCNELLVDGFEAPPGILRTRRDPSNLRGADSADTILAAEPGLSLIKAGLRGNVAWPYAFMIALTTALIVVIIFSNHLYSRARRTRIVTSMAKSAAYGQTITCIKMLRGVFIDSALLGTMHNESECNGKEKFSAGNECIIVSVESPTDEIEAHQGLDPFDTTPYLTKIGVSYYSEDDHENSEDEETEDVLEPSSRYHALQETDLDTSQDPFHLTSPSGMSQWFEADVTNLRDIIMDATTTCKSFDKSGKEISTKLSDSFCEDNDLEQVIITQKSFIKRLYVEAKKAQMYKDGQVFQRNSSQVVQDANSGAETFYDGVMHRRRAFAILVSISASPISQVWERFERDCFEPENGSKFLDAMLPFDIPTARSLLGNDYESFYSRQWHFCPFKLSDMSVVEFLHPEDCLRLPLIEKRNCGGNVPWEESRIKTKRDVFSSVREGMTVGMKQLSYDRSTWEFMKKLVGSGSMHKSLARLNMALRTQSHIYVFFDAGTCNLYEYMTTFKPSGPLNFPDAKDHFRAIIAIAEATTYSARIFDTLEGRENTSPVDTYFNNVLVACKDGVPAMQLAHPDFPRRGFSMSHQDLQNFRVILACYIAWLSGGAGGLAYIHRQVGDDIVQPPEPWHKYSASTFRVEDFELWLSNLTKSDVPEENLFYDSLRWLYTNHLHGLEGSDLRQVCGILRKIYDSAPIEELMESGPPASRPSSKRSPTPISGSSPPSSKPSGWRRRLPWNRRQASVERRPSPGNSGHTTSDPVTLRILSSSPLASPNL